MKTIDPEPLPEGPLTAEETGEILWRQRVAGASERQLTKFHRISIRQVQDAIDVHCPKLDTGKRRRTLGLCLERLDGLLTTFYPRARTGDAQAAVIVLKIVERISVLTGLETAPQREVIDASAEQQHRPSGVDIIEQALRRIAEEGQPPRLEGPEPPVVEGPESSLH